MTRVRLFSQAVDRFRSASLLMKISSLLGIVSFFVSIRVCLILCGMSAAIAVYDVVVGAKKRRLKMVLDAIGDGELQRKISELHREP